MVEPGIGLPHTTCMLHFVEVQVLVVRYVEPSQALILEVLVVRDVELNQCDRRSVIQQIACSAAMTIAKSGCTRAFCNTPQCQVNSSQKGYVGRTYVDVLAYT